jgi:hypothetical protein
MSKQFRVYLLPSDATRLAEEMVHRLGARILSESSPIEVPTELPSPVQEQSIWFQNGVSIRCCLVPPFGRIDRVYYSKPDRWTIQPSSEAIQFSGCDFDGATLLVGRMYFQTDELQAEQIRPRKAEFSRWAHRLFHYAKTALSRDTELDAYVGRDARTWRSNGGEFRLRPYVA